MFFNTKDYQAHPMTWCTYLQSFEKNAFSSYSAKNKRDGWSDGRTGALQYLPPRAYGAAEDNNRALVIAPNILMASSRVLYFITLTSTCLIPTHTSTPLEHTAHAAIFSATY